MRARGNRLVGLVLVAMLSGVLGVTHTVVAVAQPAKPAVAKEEPKEQAKKLYKDATAKFKAEDYAGALPLFKQADELYPGAAPKHKIAVCHDKLGNKTEAVTAYRAFLAADPGDKLEAEAKESTARLAELEKGMPGKLTVKVTPETARGVTITVDGNAVQGTELELEADKEHTVVVQAEGHKPATEKVTVRGNESRDLAVSLTPEAVAPPPAPKPKAKPKAKPKQEEEEEEGGSSNVPAYVTLGIAGAGIVLGVVFGVMALQKKKEFDRRIDAADATPTELQDIADDAERAALIADMSFGVALTFGITGAVLLFSGGDDDDEDEEEKAATARPTLVPYAGPTGGGMAATWRF